MKQIKLLGVLAIALTLGLSACNNAYQKSNDESQAGNVSECAKHEWGAKETIKEPTCTEPGQSQRTCKVCGAKEEPKEIKALGHDLKVESNRVEPTCTEPGKHDLKCSRCDYSEKDIAIDPLGHDFQDLGESATGYVAPDFGVPGVMPQKCSRCDATNTREIAALTRGFTISDASLVKKDDGKVYFRLAGTCDHYTVDSFKWAFALQDYNNGQSGGDFLAGKENPEAADFNIPVTLTPAAEGETADSFTVDFNMSDIEVPEGVDKPGRYNVMAGPQDNYNTINVSLNPGNYADASHRYYFRNDQEVGNRLTVCIEELPPFFHFTNAVASFVEGVDGEGNPTSTAWVRIYGEALDQTKAKSDLEEDLAATHTACRFQSSSNNMTTRNAEGEFRIEVTQEGGKLIVSVWVNIQFMIDASNTVYNTHLNLKAGATINAWRDYTNCVMEGDFENILEISETRELVVFSHPLGANDVENSYGNLGFRTRDKSAA